MSISLTRHISLLPFWAWAAIGAGAILFLALALVISPLVALGVFILLGVAGVIMRSPFIGLLLLVASLPLERIGAYEVQGMTLRMSQVLLVLITISMGIRLMGSRLKTPVRYPVTAILGVYMLVAIVSLVNSANIDRSITILVFTLFTMLLTWMVPAIVTSEHRVRIVVATLLVTAGVVSVFGLYQFFGDMIGLPQSMTGLRDLYTKDVLGFPRIQSTAYEPLYFANYLLFALSAGLCFLLGKIKLIPVSWLVTFLLIGCVSFVLTVSRGAYLGLVGALGIIAVYYFKRVFTLRNIVLIPIIVVAVWWIVVKTLGFGGDAFTLDKFTGHVQGVFLGASYDERVATFELARIAWHEHPFIGIGVGSFGPYTAPHPYVQPKDGWKIVNNEYVEVLAETGILGVAALALFFSTIMIRSVLTIRRTSSELIRTVMIAALAALVGSLIQYLTFSTLYIMHIWFLVGMNIALQAVGYFNTRVSTNNSL